MFDVREKPKMVERAYLIGLADTETSEAEAERLLEELAELVNTLGIGVVGREVVRLRQPQARYLVGKGKVASILSAAAARQSDCLVLDAELSPAQQRNWEAESGLCVIDREEVILDIFSQRAQTREAVLQVELARAEHSLPRLKNAWTHLSRQRGGGGVTQRGEGEAQIELDARMVRQRISKLKQELGSVVQHRATQRKQRQRVPLPSAAIVGYTNAGKSTLLNALTGSEVVSEDKLFATLDPTTRQLKLPSGQKLLLTDTVGFVRRLPHQLVEAFKATLEEALLADFLINVVDASNPEFEEHLETTLAVLDELGAEGKRILTVFNKIDCCKEAPRLLSTPERVVRVSARSGTNLDGLVRAFDDILSEARTDVELLIPFDHYGMIHRLHTVGAITEQHSCDEGIQVRATLPQRLVPQFEAFQKRF
jgi:GTP-binding protein HflX